MFFGLWCLFLFFHVFSGFWFLFVGGFYVVFRCCFFGDLVNWFHFDLVVPLYLVSVVFLVMF